ncbi:MAG TPA: glycosyltransferase, partial [Elusimicrobiales bacterium]|nr:glycosyltransferase [Elusimicrobiales bacterium]
MKLLLNAQGSFGDFRPLLTLAKGLKARGHQVTLCAPPDFEGLCSSSGIPYRRLGPEIARIIEKYAPEIATPLDGALFLSRTFLKETLSQYFEQLLPLAEGSDMLIGSGIDFSGGSIAERACIPYRFVAFSPVAFASSQH